MLKKAVKGTASLVGGFYMACMAGGAVSTLIIDRNTDASFLAKIGHGMRTGAHGGTEAAAAAAECLSDVPACFRSITAE